MPHPIEPLYVGALRLRPYERGDLDRLASLLCEPRTMAPLGGAIRRDEVVGILERYLASDDPKYLIVLAALRVEDGDYVGSGRLVRTGEDGVELGYIVRHELWGRGYGTSIAKGLMQAAARIGAERVGARTATTNLASQRVLEKAGLIRQGAEADAEGMLHYRQASPSADDVVRP